MTASPTRSAEVALGIASLVPSVALYNGFFDTWSYLPAVTVAMAMSAALAILGHLRRWRVVTRIVVAMTGFLAVAVPTALTDTLHRGPSLDTAIQLGRGVAGGWARMLSVSLPAAMGDEVMVALVLFIWAFTYSVVLLTLATRSVVAPTLPAVCAHGVALVMVATRVGTHLVATAVLAAILLALIMIRAGRTRSGLSRASGQGRGIPWWRRALAATLIAVVTIAAGTAITDVGLFGDGSRRADPRPLVPDDALRPDLLTPLATVKPQRKEEPPRPVLTVTISSGKTVPPGVTIAALDHFDGVTWTTDEDFLAAGQRLAVDDQATTDQHQVVARFTIHDLRTTFVPVVGSPRQLVLTSGPSVDVGLSRASGSLITNTVLSAGATYDAEGTFAPPSALPRSARPSDTPAYEPYRELPADLQLPPYVRWLTGSLTATEPSPAAKLAAIDNYLRALPYNVDAAPGHSYSDIARVVGAKDTHDDGYEEQHASAFAVMARQLGYPARVVVGYRLHNSRNNTFDVTTKDATAWAEVHFDGYGWIAYDPTDVTRTQRDLPPQAGANITPTPTPADPRKATDPNSTAPPPQVKPPVGLDALTVVLIGALMLAALAVLYGIVILATKAMVRRRRRRASSSAACVCGAWEESVDRLTELRLTPAAGRTPSEAAHFVSTRLHHRAAALVLLAEPVTTAVFGPEHISEYDADHAWRLERQLRSDLYRGRRWLARPRTLLSLRPLLARRPAARRARRSTP
jgi:transglutaminase-like putative cysteine protease